MNFYGHLLTSHMSLLLNVPNALRGFSVVWKVHLLYHRTNCGCSGGRWQQGSTRACLPSWKGRTWGWKKKQKKKQPHTHTQCARVYPPNATRRPSVLMMVCAVRLGTLTDGHAKNALHRTSWCRASLRMTTHHRHTHTHIHTYIQQKHTHTHTHIHNHTRTHKLLTLTHLT